MTPYLSTDRATLWHGRAEEVYPHLTPGSVSMVWSDGPYALKKAAWDMMGVDGLADWYAPHVEAWGRVCAPSATVYLWNTAEGWARIDPVMRAEGWTFRVLIVWEKLFCPSLKGVEALTTWADVTEVCGTYIRQEWTPGSDGDVETQRAVGRDPSNVFRLFLRSEWLDAGLSRKAANIALGSSLTGGGMATHFFSESQWEPPTFAAFEKLARYADAHGKQRSRPYLRHPSALDTLDASYRHLMATHHVLMQKYDAKRVCFKAPAGDHGNLWKATPPQGDERMALYGGGVHPCQKPLAFASRAVLASTRVGDTILDPFAGTNRVAVACRRLPEEERRHAIGIEMDRRWLDAVRPSLIADHGHTGHAKQPSLFR